MIEIKYIKDLKHRISVMTLIKTVITWTCR